MPFLFEWGSRIWHGVGRMTTLNRILVSFLVALAIWLFFAWPVPRAMTSAISSASLNVKKGGERAMIPGDHLQLLYQFWLTGETLKGQAPVFVNPYEFNTGNDADGAFRGTYYVPFSLFYTVGAALGGRAFGYNFNQLVTMGLTFLFLWLLVRRYCRDDGLAAVAALIGAGLPYAWITLFDGSPTGLAMMWVPFIYWALDIMVADRKGWAGALAGVGICLAESDSHVFFFVILSSPFWCALSYRFHFPRRRVSPTECRSLLKAGLGLLFFLGVAVWQVWIIRHSIQDTTLTVASRSIEEIRAGSPPLSGLVKLINPGEGRMIYVGGYLVALLGLGTIAFLRARRRNRQALSLAALVGLGVGIAGVALLATGVMNPGGPRAWKVVMALIPPYAVIRQPHKIFCLMPSLLAVASGILLPYLLMGVSIRWRMWVGLALVFPLVLDYGFRVRPTLCRLDGEQGAFKAIAEDARATGNTRPHLLSLPIWPGDSHYDSLNEYYISLYGLRMVNGYGGSVRKSYQDGIFNPLESMNLGTITDTQLDFLGKRGVGYLVLHEDCFPEKVSPFPVGLTLESLLNHPRLKSIGQDGAMRSFKILPPDQVETNRINVSFMKHYFAACRFEFEDLSVRRSEGSHGIPFFSPGQSVTIPSSLAPISLPLSWMVRVRGQGRVMISNVMGGRTNAPVKMDVASSEWTWKKAGLPSGAGAAGVGAVFAWDDGSVDIDMAFLMAGDWAGPEPGESLELPAANFFHAGYTDGAGEWVVFRAAHEPDSVVFYGPKLPLETGRYSAELVFDSPAPAGTVLGQFNIRWLGREDSAWIPVKKGSRAVAVFQQPSNVPFFLAFEFFRAADIRVRSVMLKRME